MAISNSDNSEQNEGGLFDRLVLGMGESFERYRWLTPIVMLTAIAIPVLLLIFDGPSGVWLLWNPPLPNDPNAPIYKYAAKFIIDGFGGFLISAALIMVVGYIKIQHLKRMIKKQSDEYIKVSSEGLSKSLEEYSLVIGNLQDKAIKEISDTVLTFIPTWTVLVNDEQIRHEIRRLSTSLAKSVQDQPIERRIITRSLLEGLVKRFEAVLLKLHKEGSIMDPEERRTLTGELFDATGSYVVIFHGLFPLNSGAFKWHKEYLKFVKNSVAKTGDSRAAWVFITDDSVETAQDNPAVREAIELGIPCFLVPSFSSEGGAVLGVNPRKIPERMGPLIEVFSGAFANSLHSQSPLPEGANLTWKATSFAKRGTKGSGDIKHLTVQEAIASIGDEGSVWFDDEIAKVIRASQDVANTSSMSKFLSYVCEARVVAV